ncbi:RsmF rRNA methyltransferase first C-terminal domain-containing protein [Lacticaseibacillus kribbianus]|uniref:RsmF rRNA methyltransferase first C-terminal domain-containing protein n=1 Tax=Lacticaseibacillus kribbianus TaxID=2926292 RepID=UPI001CD2910E|nr:RsmF rRNA methyltransferase first C-terminal domain-containing protein [Lacticaseibacillus kribbianus]
MTLPDGYEAKYTALLGAEAPAFLATFEMPVHHGYRVNPLRPAAALEVTGAPIPWSQWGHFGKVQGHGIDHVAGYVYSQEPSAQFVATALAPAPGDTVLDLCAAPGGKTTHLASFMQNRGVLIANEINPGRAKVLASNVERFGLQNTVVTNHDPQTLAKALPAAFDRILVDAPCSGEGMFRKDPAAMTYWQPDYPATCATRQREILTQADVMLRPGGTLVYSTCTFAPEEDEQIAAWAEQTLGWELVAIAKTGGIADGRPDWADGNAHLTRTARLWPQLLAGEGHFVAKFKKPAGDAPRASQLAVPRLSPDQRASFQAFCRQSLTTTFVDRLLWARRDQLFALPAGTPDVSGLKVIRAGLHLGTFKKGRFEASHSLATALTPADFQQTVAVSAAEYASYCHGETLARPALEGKRTVLLTLDDKSFAVGKLVNGTIKNAYPKGLRF